MYPNVSLDKTVFTHIAAVGNNHFVHCDVTGQGRQASTSMFCECFILIFKQARNILSKWKCLSMSFNKYTTIYIVITYLHLYQKLTFIRNRMSTPQCHEINVMTFDAECHEICFVGRKTNVITLMSWDLENVMRFIFSGTGPWLVKWSPWLTFAFEYRIHVWVSDNESIEVFHLNEWWNVPKITDINTFHHFPHICGISEGQNNLSFMYQPVLYCRLNSCSASELLGRYTQKCPWGDARLVAYRGYLVCSSSQLAPRIGLYTASLVSLTDVLIGWCASDCDAPTHIVTYPNKHGEYPPSPTWRASPTWRKQKAFPLPVEKAGNSLLFSEAANSPMLATWDVKQSSGYQWKLSPRLPRLFHGPYCTTYQWAQCVCVKPFRDMVMH